MGHPEELDKSAAANVRQRMKLPGSAPKTEVAIPMTETRPQNPIAGRTSRETHAGPNGVARVSCEARPGLA